MWAAPTEVAGAPGEPDDPYDSLEEAPEDFWERPNLEKGTIRRLRQRLFVPSPMGLPWFGQLREERRTILVNERGVRARIDDNWRNAGEVNVCYGSWTGFTIFPLRDVEVDWDRWKAYGWGDEGSYEEDEEQTDETGEEPENEDEAADGEDRGADRRVGGAATGAGTSQYQAPHQAAKEAAQTWGAV